MKYKAILTEAAKAKHSWNVVTRLLERAGVGFIEKSLYYKFYCELRFGSWPPPIEHKEFFCLCDRCRKETKT